MACEEKQNDFKAKFDQVQAVLKAELLELTRDAETKAKEISDDFEKDSSLAQGVGAVAGTVIGAASGPAGAVVGQVIGKLVGSLFTMDIGMRREAFSLDVPQATMERHDFGFDLPSVDIRDTDLSFDLPTIVMERVAGPPIPRVVIKWSGGLIPIPETTIEWENTWMDVPVPKMVTQHIVIGLPQVTMARQNLALDIPSITVKTTEFSADIPYITIRFMKDAGQRTASLAAALAQSVQDTALQRQLAYKQRLKAEVAPLAVEMFSCFRQQIEGGRATVLTQFSAQIQTLQNAVTAFVAKGVPQDNAEVLQANAALKKALDDQQAALKPLDDALAKLNESSNKAMEQFLGEAKPLAATASKLTKSLAPLDHPGTTISGLVAFSYE